MALFSPGNSHDPLLTLPQVGSSRPTDRSTIAMSTSGPPMDSRRRAHSNGAARPHTGQPNRHARSGSSSSHRPSSQPPSGARQRRPSPLDFAQTHRSRTSGPRLPPWQGQGASRSARGSSSRTHRGSTRERTRQSSAPGSSSRVSPRTPAQARGEFSRPASRSRAVSPSTPGTATATTGTASVSGSSSARARAHPQLLHPAALSVSAVSATSAGAGAAAAVHGPSSSVFVSGPLAVVPSPLRDGPPADAAAAPLPRRATAAQCAPTAPAARASSAVATATTGGTAAPHRSLSPGNAVSSAALARRSKCYCSHCKLAEEVLYGCPCGLARYCSTTCQRAHWSFHKTVCSCAVRAVRPPTRRCDWCRTSSQTLRQCGCGFVYYCDTQCQRADWPYHCITCSTVTSQALATALVGHEATLRGRREAATQTAHWQINVPVMDVPNPHDRDSRSGSEEEPMSLSRFPSESSLMGAGDAAAVSTSVPRTPASSRHRLRRRPSSEYESQGGAASGSYTFHQSRGSGHVASGHYADPGSRTPLSTHVAPDGASVGGEASPLHHGIGSVRAATRSRRSRHHANGSSLYNSLYMNGTASHQSAHANPAFENSAFAASQSLRWSQAPMGHLGGVPGASMSSHRHHHSSQLDGYLAGVYSGDGEFGERPGASMSTPTVRDQPGMMAFLVASRNIIEREEARARAALFSAFELAGVQLQMAVLNKLEEEGRMSILREEVRWFVLTGQPGWRKLRQQLQTYLQSRK